MKILPFFLLSLLFIFGQCGLSVDYEIPNEMVNLGELFSKTYFPSDYFSNDDYSKITFDVTSDLPNWLNNDTIEIEKVGNFIQGRCRGLFVEGHYLFVIYELADPFQIVIYDLKSNNLSEPNIVWNVNTVYPSGVYVKNGFAYISLFNVGVKIFDVRNISNITEASLYSEGLCGSGAPSRLTIDDNDVAYICCYGAGYGVYYADVSDPFNPVHIGDTTLPGSTFCHDVDFYSNIVYVAGDNEGLFVIDYNTKNIIAQNKVYEGFGALAGVKSLKDGQLLYLGDGDLMTFDVSPPSNPTKLSEVTTSSAKVMDIDLSNDLLYLADFSHFKVFDISTKNNPVLIHDISVYTTDVRASGSYAYTCSYGTNGVTIFGFNGLKLSGTPPEHLYCGQTFTVTVRATDGVSTPIESEFDIIVDCNSTCPKHYFGRNCNITTCFGIFSNDTLGELCNGKGNCISYDTCDCSNVNYTGLACNVSVHYCFGISEKSGNSCNGQGNCTEENVCLCEYGYFDPDCSVISCYGILSNDSEKVCGGPQKGLCIAPDRCLCDGNYTGENCSLSICFGIISNETDVCGGNGICKNGLCICSSGFGPGYEILENSILVPITSFSSSDFGLEWNCSLHVCDHYTSIDPRVCSDGNGTCSGPNYCTCNSDRDHGYIIEPETDNIIWVTDSCSSFLCGGYFNYDENACSSYGNGSICVSPDTCGCEEGYDELFANGSLYHCDRIIGSNLGSAGDQVVTDENLCYWIFMWNPNDCQKEFFSFLGIFLFFLFVSLCLCVCWCGSPMWCVLPSFAYKGLIMKVKFLIMDALGKIKQEEYLSFKERTYWERQFHPCNIIIFVFFVFLKNSVLLVNFFGDLMAFSIGVLTLFAGSMGLEYLILIVELVIVVTEAIEKLKKACFVSDPWMLYDKCCLVCCQLPRKCVRFTLLGITSFLLLFSDEVSAFSYVLKSFRILFTGGLFVNQIFQVADMLIRISFFKLEDGMYEIFFAWRLLEELGIIKKDTEEELPLPLPPDYPLPPRAGPDIVKPEIRMKHNLYKAAREDYVDKVEKHNSKSGMSRSWDNYKKLKDMYRVLSKYQESLEEEVGEEMSSTVKEVRKDISFKFVDKIGEFCTCWWVCFLVFCVLCPLICWMSLAYIPLIFAAEYTPPAEFYISFLPGILSFFGTGIFACFGVICICGGFSKYIFRSAMAIPICVCGIMVGGLAFIFGILDVPSSLAKNGILMSEFGIMWVFCAFSSCLCVGLCGFILLCTCAEIGLRVIVGIVKKKRKKEKVTEVEVELKDS